MVNYLARNLDNIFIGKYWGTIQLGLYSKAYQLLLLPLKQINAPITNVAVPLLSRLNNSPSKYRQTYLRILEKLVLLTMPLIVFLISAADWLIQLLLGEQWVDASNLFMWLGLAGLIQPVANSAGWLFISQDRSKQLFQWGIFSSGITILSFLLGLPYKAIGVSMSYSMTSILITTPCLFYYVGRRGPVKTKDFYLTIYPAILAAIFSVVCSILSKQTLAVFSPLLSCTIMILLIVICYFTIILLIPKGRSAIKDFINIKHIFIDNNNIHS